MDRRQIFLEEETNSKRRFEVSLPRFVALNFILFFFGVASLATSAHPHLPAVGTIKDYEATGLTSGCGNLYFTRAADAGKSPPAYVFLSRAEGRDAWMNLDGQDTRLTFLSASVSSEIDPMQRRFRYDYAAGATHIQVALKPHEQPEADKWRMRITIQRGKARRVIEAVGSPDC